MLSRHRVLVTAIAFLAVSHTLTRSLGLLLLVQRVVNEDRELSVGGLR
jgi:hypothetical protein